MSKVTDIVMNDLKSHIIEKLDLWKIKYLTIAVERDIQSPNVSVSLSDGVNIHYTLIDEIHFYDEMKYTDLAMYAVGSLSTLIELERKR